MRKCIEIGTKEMVPNIQQEINNLQQTIYFGERITRSLCNNYTRRKKNIDWSPKLFRFIENWQDHVRFQELVIKIWLTDTGLY